MLLLGRNAAARALWRGARGHALPLHRVCETPIGTSTPLLRVQQLATRAARKKGGGGGKKKKDLVITIPELCTAERFAQELRVPVTSLIDMATSLGEKIDGASSPLSAELLELLGMESGATVTVKPVDLSRRPPPSAAERATMPSRPPVVTLMGHVDHGKTSLLDAFRGSRLAAAEAGGITQAISAFTVDAGTPEAITFIDTPGHELFAAMRARGARATDLIVLVVAIDAGVQPTTVQAIEHARETGAPVVVAANKIDRDGAQEGLQRITRQLLEHGLATEEMGGEVPLVGVSATKRLHLDELREQILLQAEMLELKSEDEGPAEGVVLEATTQKGLGTVSSVLVQRGLLKPSDCVVVGTTYGKVRVLRATEGGKDGQGAPLRDAPPSTPVRISGLKELPRTGDELYVVESEARARQIAEFVRAKQQLAAQAKAEAEASERQAREHAQRQAAAAEGKDGKDGKDGKAAAGKGGASSAEGEDGGDASPRGPKLVPCLLRADSMGSLEAVKESLSSFPTERVELQIVRGDVVASLTEADVQLAETIGGFIVGFNVDASRKVRQAAEEAEVGLRLHEIIYELHEGVKEELDEAIEPVLEESTVGVGTVRELFTLTLNQKHRKEGMAKYTQVAGLRVESGEARSDVLVRVKRLPSGADEDDDLERVHDGRVISLRQLKKEIKSVREGQECGVILADYDGTQPGDTLTFYEMVPRKPSLYDALLPGEMHQAGGGDAAGGGG